MPYRPPLRLSNIYVMTMKVPRGLRATAPQPTLAQLGAAIRSVRAERDLSIGALADRAGLHAVSVSRIEGGKQNLTWSALSGLAVALDVELLDLVRLAGEQPGADS